MRLVLACLAIVLLASPARAGEIQLLASVAMKGALGALIPAFTAASGHTVVVEYGTAAAMGKKIADGAPFDVTVSTAAQIEQFAASGVVLAAPRPVVGASVASLAYRSGTPPPDIGTEDAFKAVILAAPSISTSDPANGGASANYFKAVCQRLGIAEAVTPKLLTTRPGEGAIPVANGMALYGVALSSEIAATPGTSGVPMLPGDPAGMTILAAAVAAKTADAEGARALVAFLVTAEAKAVLAAAGFR